MAKLAGTFLAAFTVLGVLLAPPGVSSASAEIHDSLLTTAEVSAYEAAITNARNTQSDLSHRTTCLSDQDQQMAATRDDREKALGNLRQRIDELSVSNNKLEQEYMEYKKNMNDSNSEFESYRNEFEHIKNIIDHKQKALEECRSYALFFCDIGYGISELFDSTNTYSDQMRQVGQRLERLDQEMKETGKRLTQSGAELSAAREEADGVRASISKTEDAIKTLKFALSRLREEEQAFQVMLGQFNLELEEAQNLAPEDRRARTARAIRDITVKVDSAMTQTTEIIVHARSALPQSVADRCLAQ